MSETARTQAELLAANWVRVQPALMAYLCSAVSDLSVAEDIAQEVAVAATRQYTAEQAERPFTPWVMGIARNQVALHFRKHYRNKLLFNSDVLAQIEETVCENEPAINARRSILDSCISKLSPKARRLVEMRYSAGMRVKDIAEHLETSSNTVAVSMARIRKTLSDCVSNQMKGDLQ